MDSSRRGTSSENKEDPKMINKRTGGVTSYTIGKQLFFKVNVRLPVPGGGSGVQFRKRKIPTRDAANALVALKRTEAFEGRYFNKQKGVTLTVSEAWDAYKPVSERNDSSASDAGRAAHLLRHLGKRRANRLNVGDVDAYRELRAGEETVRKGADDKKTPPSPAQLDRELELLKRVLNYCVACGKLESNPLARVKPLAVCNVRRVVLDEEAFGRLLAAAEPQLKPLLVLAFDTGMRRGEILGIREDQLDRRAGIVRLEASDTKTEEARVIYLTQRCVEALKGVPQRLDGGSILVNPKTGKHWANIRKMFARALTAAKLEGVWFHDLRRSFITRARRSRIPESVVMRMSGHKTHAVFARYNIVEERDLADAAHVLDQALGGPTPAEQASQKAGKKRAK
jgi:integrase